MMVKDRSLDDVKYTAVDMREEGIKIITIGLNKIHRDADASSSITIFRDGVHALLSDPNVEKYLYGKIKEQANNRTWGFYLVFVSKLCLIVKDLIVLFKYTRIYMRFDINSSDV